MFLYYQNTFNNQKKTLNVIIVYVLSCKYYVKVNIKQTDIIIAIHLSKVLWLQQWPRWPTFSTSYSSPWRAVLLDRRDKV